MSVASFPMNGVPPWNGGNPYGGPSQIDPFRSTAIGPPGQMAALSPMLPQLGQIAPSPYTGRPPSPIIGRPPSPFMQRSPSPIPTQFTARPPSPVPGQMVPRIPSPVPLRYPPQFGRPTPTKTQDQKLDSVTRSRNALIIVAIVMTAGFLACFITLLVILYPPPSLQNFDVQVISTRSDFNYAASDLTSSDNYAFKVMETTMCSQVIGSASRSVSKFENASPGVRAYVLINVSLDGKTPTELVKALGEAIIRAAAVDADWSVGMNDISVVSTGLTR